MNGFERRKERKKESIRHAALQLYMEHGLRKVSIEEIAAKAGVSQVTIYNYFGSKDELTLFVLRHYIEEQVSEFQRVYESPRTFMEKMEWFMFQKSGAFDTMSLEFLDAFASSDPEIAALMKQYESQTVPILMGFIQQGKEQGYINPELSLETLMFYIHLFGNQAMQQLQRFPAGEQNRTTYKELLTVFFCGVGGERADEIRAKLEQRT